MGLLTGLALAGGLLAGKMMGGKKDQPQQPQQAGTVPVAPGSQIAGPQPPQINLGANMAQATAAGQRARKRAASGNLLTPRPPAGDKMPTNPNIRPRTLIGY